MPLYYYKNKDSKDSSLLYKLDNWPGCNGAVAYYMANQGKTIGEAYDIVLGDVTNAKECQK